MSTERSLLIWFKSNRNLIVKEKLVNHATAVRKTCEESISLYKSIKHTSNEKLLQIISQISLNEETADKIQDELAEKEIIHGEFPANIQEDLFRMIRRIDEAANWVKTASKNANLMLNLKLNYPDPLIEYLIQLSEITRDSVILFIETLNLLGVNDQKILVKRNKIEKLERQGDDVYYLAKEAVLRLSDKLPNSVLFLSLDSAKALENASDACSKASDYLYSIVMAAPVK
ncbi:MAG: DUF47 family protein [Candidatus Heimdallarchaeota archaeon]|nr:DUF47 family protein [Candidatus Heimdallarchaeota archaeon]